MVSDNPADRLLHILKAGKQISLSYNCRKAWCQLLDVDDASNHSLLMSRLGKVMALPDEIVSLLDSHDGIEPEVYQHWVSQINAGFSNQSLTGTWESFIKFIDSHAMSNLALTSTLLRVTGKRTLIDEVSLQETTEKLHALLSEVMESELADDVKAYVVKSLQKIITALNEYKITGSAPILETIEASFGHAVVDERFRESMNDSETGRKVWDILANTANTVSVATGLGQIGAAALQLLQ